MSKDTGKVMIHGKEYETVASRVQKFRTSYENKLSIETELIERNDDSVVMKATIRDLANGGNVIATGHAEESRTASTINRTSALENCETSAIGRCLASFGMGGTEFASADEVAQAIHQQSNNQQTRPAQKLTGEATDKQRQTISRHLTSIGIAQEDQSGYLIEQLGVSLPLDKQTASEVIDMLFSDKSARQETP